ncbi:MAG: glutathione peroxidase [Elusimicrobia bacterium]|nr:glutathione peroxidase [Elusimicrobiota bacterium]MDE2237656.1 glutathione peroxidase [Elusimicrobiota bacterium]MDE2424325.1 glutathione peroxidase [Elusimicrobiota bacterium]
MTTNAGEKRPLAAYKGRVLLLVNTASLCGFTPQYDGLNALDRRYRARGLSILAFPCNDFGSQEPGSDAQIREFCRSRYSIGFDLFSKISVRGPAIHPLYRFLTAESGFDGEIGWNFEKFLVDREGRVIARFASEDAPKGKAIVAAVEKALAAG